MKHLLSNHNATTLGPLFDKSFVNNTPKADTVTSRQVTYSVIGNHPVLARPDKFGIKSFNEAVEYSTQLVKDGFEGVTIKEDYACLESDDATTASMLTGKELKEKGLALVRENNENWMQRCLESIQNGVGKHWILKSDFTGEDIRFFCLHHVEYPKHPNAWGALINTLIKRNIIVPTGEYRPMKDKNSHARSTPVYKAYE